jgi:hypothetical protein
MAEALARELARIRSDAEVLEQRRYFRDRFSWPASGRRYLGLTGPKAPRNAAHPAALT